MTSVAAAPAHHSRPRLRRDPQTAVVAGVCSGLAQRLLVDPLVLRIAFVLATLAGGVGLAAYVVAWAAVPAAEGRTGQLPSEHERMFAYGADDFEPARHFPARR